MHILKIASWYKTSKEPFMGTFFEEQARGLMHAGHQVGIIHPVFIPFRSLFDEKPENPVHFYVDNGLPTITTYIQALTPNIRNRKYRQLCNSVEKVFLNYTKQYGMPDVLHAHSVFFGGIAGGHLSQKFGIPMVITEHLTSFIMGTITHYKDLKIARDIFISSDCSIIVSHSFKNDLIRVLQINEPIFKVIPNMVSDLFFENRKAKTYSPDEPFILFTNSFLLPRKNHKLIINALKILIDQQKNVRLIIGGDGESAHQLKEYISELGIGKHVEMPGGLNRQAVKACIDRSHAFILASFYETFGVVLIESLAVGRPVITTNSGGPEDFINEHNGILLRDFNPQSMANAIRDMMNNYSRYDQDKISDWCRSLFSERVVISQLESTYKEVIAKRKKVVS